MSRREHPRYETTEWPDYEFREYPKMVYPGAVDPAKPYGSNGKPLAGILVKSPAEERQVLNPDAEAEEEAPRPKGKLRMVPTGSKGVERLRTEDDEHAELNERADTLGIPQFDKSWSLARKQDAIDTFTADDPEPAV